jgi:hypothetical protein
MLLLLLLLLLPQVLACSIPVDKLKLVPKAYSF